MVSQIFVISVYIFCIVFFLAIFWLFFGVVRRGVCRRGPWTGLQGGPRTGGHCFRVTRLSDVLEGSSFIILPRASLFVGRVGRFKLYCCLVGKLFCYVVKKFRRCNLSKPEESVCHFWTLYINQIAFCFEQFAMFDRTDPLWSQIKSAK